MPISIADLQSLQQSLPPTSANYGVIQQFLNNPALLNSQIGQDQLASVLGTAQQGIQAQQNPTYTYTDPSGQTRTGTSVPTGATNISSSASKLSTTYNPATVQSLQQQLTNNPATSAGIPSGSSPSAPSGSAAGQGGNPIGGVPSRPPFTGPRGTQPSTGFQYNPISINNPYSPGTTPQTSFPNAVQTNGGNGYSIPNGAPPAGANSAFPNWTNTPGGNGQGYNAGDPGYMASAEANRAIDYGNTFENQYGPEYQQALAQENAYGNAADAAYNQLSQTPGYTDQEAQAIQSDPYAVQGVVGQTSDAMNAAIDPSKLGFSDQYVQELKDQAAGQIGAQYGANMDALQREADASGNVNPLALAAARNRYLQSQAIDSANALTGADIQATGAQRQANTNIANMRLGAATTIGGMGLQAGQYADTAASNRAANIAQQRIQGQQAARNYWQSQQQFQGGQANQATQARLAGAQTSLSGMGQGGSLAAQTEIGRRATANRLNVGVGPGGVSVGTSVGV